MEAGGSSDVKPPRFGVGTLNYIVEKALRGAGWGCGWIFGGAGPWGGQTSSRDLLWVVTNTFGGLGVWLVNQWRLFSTQIAAGPQIFPVVKRVSTGKELVRLWLVCGSQGTLVTWRGEKPREMVFSEEKKMGGIARKGSSVWILPGEEHRWHCLQNKHYKKKNPTLLIFLFWETLQISFDSWAGKERSPQMSLAR